MRNITVVGVGYVGLVTGACFSDLGNKVIALDINVERIENLKKNVMPIYEPGLAEVVARSRRDAQSNEFAQLRGDLDVDGLLAEPYFVSPLRMHDCPPISDGAAAIVLAAGDLAREVCENPAWMQACYYYPPHYRSTVRL